MALIYLVFLCLHLMVSRCQPQCDKETLDDKDFSLNVTEHVTAECGDCIRIPYKLTFPTSKVTAPYTKIWFKRDNSNTVNEKLGSTVESDSEDSFWIRGLPRGEHEYGFRLEWGCNQTYVFPKTVHISVSASTRKPSVSVPPMVEGDLVRLRCRPPPFCSQITHVYWKWTQTDGRSEVLDDYSFNRFLDDYKSRRRDDNFILRLGNNLQVIPTADHHNTNITCVVEYDYDTVETTVTMTVKFPPKILYGSQCFLKGKLLVCVCISRGNPLSPITWSLADLTDYSVTSSSSIQTVNSTVTMPAADYHNTTVRCVSSNELGLAQIEIPLQNDTENTGQNSVSTDEMKSKSAAVGPWIIVGLSLSLNLVLLAAFIIYIYKGRKSQQEKSHEENNTYATLNMADVGELYSAIPSQNK